MDVMSLDSEEEMLERLRERRKEFPSIAAFAKFCKVSPQFMSKVLAGAWHPGQKVAAALGYHQVIAFVKDPNIKPKPDKRQKSCFDPDEHADLLARISENSAPVRVEDWE
jgi:hypothetical protein